jgi:ribosomal protein S18 acetylase RimI-like enzyme
MSKSGFVPDIKRLDRHDWETLRHLRLTALADSPDAFLATYAKEDQYDPAQWQAEFDRGAWYIYEDGDGSVGLIGATREPQMPFDECYLEFIWVPRERRGTGMAFDLVDGVLNLLRADRYRIAYLWVLDGNAAAMGLYKKLGFVSTDERHTLDDRPGRTEERFMRDLS